MQNRYNVFNQIHKALRHLFYDTALAIQQTDFDKPSAAGTVSKVRLVLDLLDEHSHHEDTYLFPNVMQHEPALAASFGKDHEVDHKLTEELREHLAAWETATTEQQKIAHGQSIFYAFNEFVAFNLYHMNREENELLYALWKYFTDAELLQMQQQIIDSIRPEIMALESAWMMRSLSNGEIVGWLRAVKHSAPEEIHYRLMHLAKENLTSERFAEVHAAVEKAETVA